MTLEKQVQRLKETNEEMSDAFMKLHDFAVSQGLLADAPEFGHQLRATTEKFLALARRSSEEDGYNDEGRRSDSHESEQHGELPSALSSRKRQVRQKSNSPEVVTVDGPSQTVKNASNTQLYGGFIVSHEPATVTEPIDQTLATFQDPPVTSAAQDYEIITQPTFENASFPFILPESPFADFFDPSPYPQLSPPRSYAIFETTFGRRLQRFTLETAYSLITDPNPPPTALARVFGFCMVFEPIHKIKERLRAGLEKSRQESLNNWQYPFVNLGGAGTQFSTTTATAAATTATSSSTTSSSSTSASSPSPPSAPIGNQGAADPLHPRFDTGFSTGPFDRATTQARDAKLDPKMRILMPGFEGSFFDCDETELYLRMRGVEIPPGSDSVVAEVDPAAFSDDLASALAGVGMLTDTTATTATGGGVFGPSSADFAAVANLHGIDVANALASAAATSRAISPSSILGPDPAGAGTNSASAQSPWGELGGGDYLLPPNLNPYLTTTATATATTSAPAFGDATSSSLLSYAADISANSASPLSGGSAMSSRKLVTLDVNQFMRGEFPDVFVPRLGLTVTVS